MVASRFLPMLLFSAFTGCGADEVGGPTTAYKEAAPAATAAPAMETPGTAPMAPDATAGMANGTPLAMASMMQRGTAGKSAETPAIARKIIYDAQVDLVVESVDKAAKKVLGLVQQTNGYIAEQSVLGSPGSTRSMRWKLRIPVEGFDSFVDSVAALGELEKNNRTSQDVTEQYFDIEARIKNKKLEEETLNKILQERSGKLEDVLKIEVELARVRGEVEQFEGRIRVLANLSSLATITLNIREREKYAPPAPVVADFPTQIARTWGDSISELTRVGKGLVLFVVSTAVWIPFYLIGAILAWIVLRWLNRIRVRFFPDLISAARTPITRPRAPAPPES